MNIPASSTLVIDRDAIRMGEHGAPIVLLRDGLIAESDLWGDESGASIGALLEPLRGVPEGPLALAIDAHVPFATVVAVLYTGARAGHRRHTLWVRSGGSIAALPTRLPLTPDDLAHVDITVMPIGIAWSTPEHPDAPATLPRNDDGTHDWVGLRDGLTDERARELYLGPVAITALPETAFGDIAEAILVARGTADAPLFPEVVLSAPALLRDLGAR